MQITTSMIKLKDILTEQLFGLASTTGVAARTGFNLSKGGGGGKVGSGRSGRTELEDGGFSSDTVAPNITSSEEKIQKLFKTARTWQSSKSDWQSVKSIALAMRDEMSGIGSGDTLQFLKKIKTKPQLAAIVKNFVFNGDDLYDWLDSEYSISWDSVVKALSAFKSDMPKFKSTTMSS